MFAWFLTLEIIALSLECWEEPFEGGMFLSLHEAEALAKQKLDVSYYDYYAGCSDDCLSASANEMSFGQIKILPRVLRNVSHIDTSTTLWGMKMSMPLMVAPMAMHGLADRQNGEIATFRAASSSGIPEQQR